ncbi:MAG: hypothetical protein WCE79_10750 [Xanthobacteraceae bacterium]
MDKKAVDAARIEFDRAFQSITDMGGATHLAEIERHWSAFLVASGRVYTKLEQGAKSNPRSYGWWGQKVHERRNDPLLSYLWHARNADEHTLGAVTHQDPGYARQVEPTAEERARFEKEMTNFPHPFAVFGVIEAQFAHVKLLDVMDRGVTYKVPYVHKGSEVANPHPNNVGLFGLKYLEETLQEAEALMSAMPI